MKQHGAQPEYDNDGKRTGRADLRAKGTLTKKVFTLCIALRWNWAMGLPVPAGTSWEKAEHLFHRWIADIELADGTMNFRWARLVTRPKDGSPKKFHVLLGGLGSGEWRWWAQRWGHICGDAAAVGDLEYRRGRIKLRNVLGRLVAGKEFGIEVGVGPVRIRQDRCMSVDSVGVPTDSTIRNALRAQKTTALAEQSRRQLSFDFESDAEAPAKRSR